MFKRLITSALIFGAAALAPPAFATHAGPACALRGDMATLLSARFREGLVGGGMQNPKEVLEVWASPETGSFTILITNANGISCIVASGQNWIGKLSDPPTEAKESPEVAG